MEVAIPNFFDTFELSWVLISWYALGLSWVLVGLPKALQWACLINIYCFKLLVLCWALGISNYAGLWNVASVGAMIVLGSRLCWYLRTVGAWQLPSSVSLLVPALRVGSSILFLHVLPCNEVLFAPNLFSKKLCLLVQNIYNATKL